LKLQDLLDARNQALAEARSYVDKKEQTAEDEAAYQRAFAEFTRLDRLVEDEKRMAKAAAEADEARAEVEEIVRPKELRKQEISHELEIREFVTPLSPRKSLFVGMPEKRTAVTTAASGAYGSYVTPQTWWNAVDMHVNAQSGVLASKCTVIRTASGEQINVPVLATDAAALIGAEGSAASVANPVFGTYPLNAYRMDGFFTVSNEFLTDSAIDAEAFLADCAGRAIATLVSTYAATGTGSAEPAGLNYTTEITTAGKTAAAQTTFTFDELIDLYLAVLPGYRMVGEWLAGSTAYAIIAKMKDDEGSYLLTNPTANEPAMILGKALREDANFQATTAALCPVTFGDMSRFWVRWARGMEFTRDDSFAFTSFSATFRFAAYFDCDLIDRTGAVKHLLMAT
jgi:HK97 family phage major capsid protein